MKKNICLWILSVVLLTVHALGQVPVRKRTSTRIPPIPKKIGNTLTAAGPTLVKTENLARQMLDSLRSDSTMHGLKIPLPGIKIDPVTQALTAESRACLDSLAAVLNRMPTLLFMIDVYREAFGDPAKIQVDAEQQARVILTYLTVNGKVAAYRSHYRGFNNQRTVNLSRPLSGKETTPRVALLMTGFDTNQDVVLTRTDSTRLMGVFAYKDGTSGNVYIKRTANSPLLELPADQVSQIEYQPHVENVAAGPSLSQTKSSQADSVSTAPSQKARPGRGNYRYSTFTVGVEGLYVPAALSPQWADDAIGLGFRQGIGGSLAFTRRLGRWVGVTIQAGYGQWEVQRLYTLKGETQYDEQVVFNHLFLKAGLKIYVWSGLYIMPEATLHGVQISTKTGANNPVSMLHDKQQGVYAGYGGSLGYDLRIKRFAVDVSAFYTDLSKVNQPIVWYYSLTNPLRYVGGRVGVGFQLSRP